MREDGGVGGQCRNQMSKSLVGIRPGGRRGVRV